MRVSLIQMRSPADAASALAQAEPLVRQAAAEGARLIITPEGTNLLEKDRAKFAGVVRSAEDDVAVQGLRALAKECGAWILIGSALVQREDGKAANRALLIDPTGAVTASYDKLHMFDADLPTGESPRESALYTPGDHAVVADVEGARLGLTICYDVRFPALYRALASAGAQIMTVPAAFTRPTGEAHWEVLLRARAIETGSYVLAAAQGGDHADGRCTWGRSTAIGPWGEILAKADHDEPCVLTVDLELDAVARARTAIPALINARPFTGP